MQNKTVNLQKFTPTLQVGASVIKNALWYITNICLFKTSLFPFVKPKLFVLKCFGAKIGKNIMLKPSVNIKFPWKLSIGDNTWIGENVWIDNLDFVKIGNNVCISQGVYLLTGNHNYKLESFDLITKPILIDDGVWIGAKSTICPGVTCKSHAILTVGSVATSDLQEYKIYQGIPAIEIRERNIL